MLNLPRKITNLFIFQGTDKPVACQAADFQVIVQKLNEHWFKDPKAVQELDIIDTNWKSGKGSVEGRNSYTVKWVCNMISKIEMHDSTDGSVLYFRAYSSEELKKVAFANVFLDNRYALLKPIEPIVGALRRLKLNSEDVSVVKTLVAKAKGKVKGRVVRIVVNDELAKTLKEFQDKYVCLRAGCGYIKFDFDKKDDLEDAKKTAVAAMDTSEGKNAIEGEDEETLEMSPE